MLCSFLVLPLLTHGKRMSDCNTKESMHTCEANKTRQVIAQRLIDGNGFSWTGELVACAKISVWILLLLTVVYIAGCGYSNHPRDSFYHHVSRMHRGWEKIRGDAVFLYWHVLLLDLVDDGLLHSRGLSILRCWW